MVDNQVYRINLVKSNCKNTTLYIRGSSIIIKEMYYWFKNDDTSPLFTVYECMINKNPTFIYWVLVCLI
jgi:hypothetical protein